MNYDQPRQLESGGWHYTSQNDDRVWPVGYCADHRDAPHATEDEARACYARYLLEQRTMLDGTLGDWNPCEAPVGVRDPDQPVRDRWRMAFMAAVRRAPDHRGRRRARRPARRELDPLVTTGKSRASLLTTTELYHLDQACQVISRAFGGEHPYLVGTAGGGGAESYRDVDVRLMLDDGEFAEVCPTRERWELLCLSIGAYLASRTGLAIDFQIQSASVANAKHGKPRNPLGMGGAAARVFAGGGDGTPDWGPA